MTLDHLKPRASRSFLLLTSGLMWSVVGILLCRLAISWYITLGFTQHIFWFSLSIPTALAIHFFGFSKLAQVNIPRIQNLPPKPCVFAFMQWWNYPLVIFMISLGIWMRHSPIAIQYLGILYFGIGAGLFLASLLYYSSLIPGQSLYRKLDLQPSLNPKADVTATNNPEPQ